MRFFGAIGYGESAETPPESGVWVDSITERSYRGDVVRNIKRNEPGENLNDDLKVNNAISIVADEHAYNHFFAIKYVVWQDVRWTVSAVEVRPPRLILNLGEVYNGPTP
jgi:hypothetical protein